MENLAHSDNLLSHSDKGDSALADYARATAYHVADNSFLVQIADHFSAGKVSNHLKEYIAPAKADKANAVPSTPEKFGIVTAAVLAMLPLVGKFHGMSGLATEAASLEKISALPKQTKLLNEDKIFLGPSGVQASAHVGTLRALDEAGLKAGEFEMYGSSGGAWVAAMFQNGVRPMEMQKVLESSEFRSLQWANPFKGEPWLIDMEKFSVDWVKRLGLKPQEKLGILTTDLLTNSAVVLKGKEVDLPLALTASTAVIGAGFRPAVVNGKLSVDGLYSAAIPSVDVLGGKAFVSKIPLTRSIFPLEKTMNPADAGIYYQELLASPFLAAQHIDPRGHTILETGRRDVGILTPLVSTDTLRTLEQTGYERTRDYLNTLR